MSGVTTIGTVPEDQIVAEIRRLLAESTIDGGDMDNQVLRVLQQIREPIRTRELVTAFGRRTTLPKMREILGRLKRRGVVIAQPAARMDLSDRLCAGAGYQAILPCPEPG